MQFKNLLFATVILALMFWACEKDTPALPDNIVEFESAEVGFDSNENTKKINLHFSRAVDVAGEIVITVSSNGIEQEIVNSMPAISSGELTITVEAGQTSAEINLTKKEDVFLSGNEYMTFAIEKAMDGLVVGNRKELKLQFSSIVSEGGTMTLQGGEGGASAANSVYVNFKSNTQTQASRDSWDLALWCGDDFRVILNNTAGAGAMSINKTSLTSVNANDTVGMNLSVATSNPDAISIIDDFDGDLSKTVFGDIDASADNSKVFIVNRGIAGAIKERGWKKVKVTRNANGYTLEYADITSNDVKTIQIEKKTEQNFIYVSFNNGIVNVEPKKDKWDIVWTGGIYKSGVSVHYFADQVLINNRAGVTTCQVLTSDVSWDNFSESHLSALTFSDFRSTIGSSWRNVGGHAGGTVGVFTDRFYVVKDALGNYYKLRFINFHSADGGTRGYPNIEYKLVKKAAN